MLCSCAYSPYLPQDPFESQFHRPEWQLAAPLKHTDKYYVGIEELEKHGVSFWPHLVSVLRRSDKVNLHYTLQLVLQDIPKVRAVPIEVMTDQMHGSLMLQRDHADLLGRSVIKQDNSCEGEHVSFLDNDVEHEKWGLLNLSQLGNLQIQPSIPIPNFPPSSGCVARDSWPPLISSVF